MDAKDLMIGDWVQHRDEFNEVTGPYEIDLISNDEIAFKGEMFARVFNNSIEPIPLTPEILEKNGWEERKEYEPYIYYLLKGKDYSISLSKEWDSTTKTIYWSLSIGNHITDACFSVDYVHQIQNALRLCGIKKEIVL